MHPQVRWPRCQPCTRGPPVASWLLGGVEEIAANRSILGLGGLAAFHEDAVVHIERLPNANRLNWQLARVRICYSSLLLSASGTHQPTSLWVGGFKSLREIWGHCRTGRGAAC